MLEVNVSDLRNRLPEFLDKAEAGEEILVTRRGRVVARLTAAHDTRASAKEQLATLRKRAHVGDVVSPIEADWEAAR
ncbi:MAG: type II toxin-antitoxin system prevent-host-death family antitoxin [Pseudomonadota bacterium]|nr:type II toxin-antitoxin system prevent-host-death family antitoxin [Pseudomonadota bacterium]